MEFLKSFFQNIIVRNVLAILLGIIVGVISMMIIHVLGMKIFPLPAEVDFNKIETIIANIDKYSFWNFISVFLAHSAGPFFGSFIVYKIAASHKLKLSFIVASLFFLSGIDMVRQIPAPTWFCVLDLVGAYFPMAWLGGKIAERFTSK
jgi:hypothetical protein